MQKLQSQSLAESYIALADFLKAFDGNLSLQFMLYAHSCWNLFCFPLFLKVYSTFNPKEESGQALSQARLALRPSAEQQSNATAE